MKKAAIFTLIKDLVLAVAFGGIAYACLEGSFGAMNALGMAMLLSGIPFGWRWSSKIITAVSIQGIVIKLVISLILGWLAIFVVIIGDIIRCFTAPSDRAGG